MGSAIHGKRGHEQSSAVVIKGSELLEELAAANLEHPGAAHLKLHIPGLQGQIGVHSSIESQA